MTDADRHRENMEHARRARLSAMRGPGESYSDVILRARGPEIGRRHSRPLRCSAWRRYHVPAVTFRASATGLDGSGGVLDPRTAPFGRALR